MKGRNIFMGYFKNEKATAEIFDNEGYIHSGDLGTMHDGFLEITGRIKELIITAGGENIAPVLIEDVFKEECPICSNIMIVGDNKRFLSAIITLKVNLDVKTNTPSHTLSNECKIQLRTVLPQIADSLTTVEDAIKHPEIIKFIN
jgi:long-chain-fatty-acid--CoA ligase ACSBG